jgi:hypothetical protein
MSSDYKRLVSLLERWSELSMWGMLQGALTPPPKEEREMFDRLEEEMKGNVEAQKFKADIQAAFDNMSDEEIEACGFFGSRADMKCGSWEELQLDFYGELREIQDLTATVAPELLERLPVEDMFSVCRMTVDQRKDNARSIRGVLGALLKLGKGNDLLLPTIWYHGGRSYSTDGLTPIIVSNEQHNVLQQFLDLNIALDTKSLEKAGVSNVSTVVTKIANQFRSDAVRRPGPNGKGDGFHIRVRSVSKLPRR